MPMAVEAVQIRPAQNIGGPFGIIFWHAQANRMALSWARCFSYGAGVEVSSGPRGPGTIW